MSPLYVFKMQQYSNVLYLSMQFSDFLSHRLNSKLSGPRSPSPSISLFHPCTLLYRCKLVSRDLNWKTGRDHGWVTKVEHSQKRTSGGPKKLYSSSVYKSTNDVWEKWDITSIYLVKFRWTNRILRERDGRLMEKEEEKKKKEKKS